jgi:hypothetical protein
MAFQKTMFVDADEFAEGNSLSGSDDEMGLARLYRGQLGEQVRRLEALLRSADPNMRETRARLRN